LNQVGNQIGFWIQNGTTTTTTLVGFRVFKTVTAIGVTVAPKKAAVFATAIGSYTATLKSGITIASYSTAQASDAV